jgi:hypothetical protein
MSGKDRNGDGDGDGDGAMVWARVSGHEDAILAMAWAYGAVAVQFYQCPSYAQPSVSCSARVLRVRRVVVQPSAITAIVERFW